MPSRKMIELQRLVNEAICPTGVEILAAQDKIRACRWMLSCSCEPCAKTRWQARGGSFDEGLDVGYL